nr:MAG TPA: transmembrane protein [Caudoviricetes sp.]
MGYSTHLLLYIFIALHIYYTTLITLHIFIIYNSGRGYLIFY